MCSCVSYACLLLLLPLLAATPLELIVQGAGTRITTALYQNAAFAYRFVKESVHMQYSPLNSGRSTCRLMSHAKRCVPKYSGDAIEPLHVDFAASDTVLKDEDYAEYPDLQMYPTVALAVVPIFNIGPNVSLTLTLQTLAQIFAGHITAWDDPRIRASNPAFMTWGVPANQTIEVAVRGDDSTSTALFKKALAGFDPGFAPAVGAGNLPDWGSRQVTKTTGDSPGLRAYVAKTQYSIGYCTLGEAADSNLPMARLQKGGAVVAPTASAIDFAVLQKGMDFGNNGEPPERLTADLIGAYGAYSWPICQYTYIVFRKATLRRGAACDHVRAAAAFWLWFWSSDFVADEAMRLGFGMPPPRLRNTLAAHLKQHIMCDGRLVLAEEGKEHLPVVGASFPAATPMMQVSQPAHPALPVHT